MRCAGIWRAFCAAAFAHRAGGRAHSTGRAVDYAAERFRSLSISGFIITLQKMLIAAVGGAGLRCRPYSIRSPSGGECWRTAGLTLCAFNVDPQAWASTPVVGQLYMLLVMLTFLALNGHLALAASADGWIQDAAL